MKINTSSDKFDIKTDLTLDVLGLICPLPAVKTALKLEKMKAGEVLEVLTSDEVSKTDLPTWCKQTGNEFLGLIEENGAFKIYIKKKE